MFCTITLDFENNSLCLVAEIHWPNTVLRNSCCKVWILIVNHIPFYILEKMHRQNGINSHRMWSLKETRVLHGFSLKLSMTFNSSQWSCNSFQSHRILPLSQILTCVKSKIRSQTILSIKFQNNVDRIITVCFDNLQFPIGLSE